METDRLVGFVHIIELTIMFGAYLLGDNFQECDLQLLNEFLPWYMNKFITVINQTEKNGDKIIVTFCVNGTTRMHIY